MENVKKFLEKMVKKMRGMDKSQWIAVILTGVLLLVIAIPVETGEKRDTQSLPAETAAGGGTDDEDSYRRQMEEQLEDILSQVDGVGKVKVMITLKDGGEQVLAKDSTISSRTSEQADGSVSSESSNEAVTVFNGEKDPVTTQMRTPDVEGVLVVAQGAGSGGVENRIYQSVMALFPVDAHKISVVKMKGQE